MTTFPALFWGPSQTNAHQNFLPLTKLPQEKYFLLPDTIVHNTIRFVDVEFRDVIVADDSTEKAVGVEGDDLGRLRGREAVAEGQGLAIVAKQV